MPKPSKRSLKGKANYYNGKKAKLQRETEERVETREEQPAPASDEVAHVSDEDISDEEIIGEDYSDFTEEELVRVTNQVSSGFLVWSEGADKKGRGTLYHKNDPRTIASKERKEREKAAGSQRIEEAFGFQKIELKRAKEAKKQQERFTMEEAALALQKYADPYKKTPDVDQLQRARLGTLYDFFTKVLNGTGKVDASLQLSEGTWKRGKRFAQRIREWANEYLVNKSLVPSKRGAYIKTACMLTDEHLKSRCLEFIRSLKPEERTVRGLQEFIQEKLVVDECNPEHRLETMISESTVRRYLKKWGFMLRDSQAQGVYIDGHERQDVVEYRKEWSKRMLEHRKLMLSYDNDDEPEALAMQIWDRRKVLVTHDETYFYSNDSKRNLYLATDESIIRKKGQGRAIMLSAFGCSCHGLFCCETIIPGAQKDGYWKKEHMAKQLESAIEKFKVLHGDCIGVFCFDQSSNHSAMPDDALNAYRMNMGPAGKQIVSRNGGYIGPDGQWVVQRMVDDAGVPRGLSAVIKERGFWPAEGLIRYCQRENSGNCCAVHLMSSQPDFQAQKSLLEEICFKHHMIFEKYPKFHCECNWIERVWAEMKRITRQECDYSFKSLQERVHQLPQRIPIQHIIHYEKRAWRFIEIYSRDLDFKHAEWAAKKYKSHRTLPPTLDFSDFPE